MKPTYLLRDYQQDIVTRVEEAWKHHRSVMVQMPTGTGKTHVLAGVVSDFKGTVLIVAHRVELVEQIIHHTSEIIHHTSAIKVFSIQTVSRRMDSFAFIPDLVIIDEAHHALAGTYRILWEKWPGARFLGLTATPCRMNGTGFTDLFDTLLTSWSIAEFIGKGVLSAFEYAPLSPDREEQRLIDALQKRGADGDYQVKEMDAVLNRRPSIERLYRSLKECAEGKKGIVYAISIGHARNIVAYYSEQGVRSAAIDSRTPREERKRLVEAFKSGEIRVLVNVDVFSEGFDCPDVEFIQMARPTLSLAKYLQQVGRGLRKSAGKERCILIDNVGLCRVFGPPTREWDWGRMFQGKQELEAWQDTETGLWGLRKGRKPVVEACYVRIFDIWEERAAVRFDNHECGMVDGKGRVIWRRGNCESMRFLKNRLLAVQEPEGKDSYLDLCNQQMYAWRPEVKRYGGFELLAVHHTCYSRTREVYASSIDMGRLCVVDRGFYLSIFERAGRSFCLLAGDEERAYRVCRRLADGSIVVADRDGKTYHAAEGMQKVYLGSGDCRAEMDRLDKEVNNRLAEEEAEKKQRILEEYHQAVPYRAGLKWGLKVGNRVTVPPIYRNMQPPVGKYCVVEMNYGQWGLISIDGSVLIEPKYPAITVEDNGTAVLTSVTGKKEVVKLS